MKIPLLLFTLALTLFAKTYTTQEAWDHVGEYATECGKVVSIFYAKRSKGEPTFLNLDKPYPNQLFTVVIWGDNRDRFQSLKSLKNRTICVTGEIGSYKEKPQMELESPRDLRAAN
jgi:hypothetical protein